PERGPGWVANLLLLLLVAMAMTVGPCLLLAREHFLAAGLAGGLGLLLGLGLVLRPLFMKGAGRLVKSGVFFVAFVSLLGVTVVPVFYLLFNSYKVPTGGMALGLPGYHRNVTCPECGHRFAINAASEVDNPGGEEIHIHGCTCENCRYHIQFPNRPADGP